MSYSVPDPEYVCAHAWCKATTWAAHAGLDHLFNPIRPCKACGAPTTGSWCSTQCFHDEDGYEDDYDDEDEGGDNDE